MIKKVSKRNSGLKGEITIPSDKSISHRAVIFGSLANGITRINNFSNGQDPLSSLNIMRNLGVQIEQIGENSLKITSNGILLPSETALNCGNSGTTMRFMMGILSAQSFSSTLIGDESLSKRPMKRVITPLTLMGADISSNDNHAPLVINGKPLHAIDYQSPIASAQVKSCILLAGLLADGKTSVTEPHLSRNHSELMLKYMGANITTSGMTTFIEKSELSGKEINICGDISSAAFFIAAALIIPNSDIILKNVGLNPTRTGILEVVKSMGGNVEILDKKEVSGELVGDIRVKYSELKACEISGEIIPRLIDEIPIIALLATQADGTTTIKDAKDLRNKESDRISAVASGLKKLGADIEELQDGFTINGKTSLKGNCELETYHDHRLAMTFYVAGLIAKEEILINGFEWVGISFPEFEEMFRKL